MYAARNLLYINLRLPVKKYIEYSLLFLSLKIEHFAQKNLDLYNPFLQLILMVEQGFRLDFCHPFCCIYC